MSLQQQVAPSNEATTFTRDIIDGKFENCPGIKVFQNHMTYLWCPDVPCNRAMKRANCTESDFQEAWTYFANKVARRMKERIYHITLRGVDKTYCRNSNKYAIVIGNNYCVCPASSISEDLLIEYGFKEKCMLVPLTGNEGYIPKGGTVDDLIY